jgi:hypothetical protein
MGRNARRRSGRPRQSAVVVWRDQADGQRIAHWGSLQLLVWECPDGHWHLEVFEHGPQRAWRSFEAKEADARATAESAARNWPPPPGTPGRDGFGDGGDDPEPRGHARPL